MQKQSIATQISLLKAQESTPQTNLLTNNHSPHKLFVKKFVALAFSFL